MNRLLNMLFEWGTHPAHREAIIGSETYGVLTRKGTGNFRGEEEI
jgi:hypothetical protein